MRLTAEQEAHIQQILSTLQCRRQVPCYKGDPESLSRVEHVAGTSIIECHEPCRDGCHHGLHFGCALFCMCPLRNYIAKALAR